MNSALSLAFFIYLVALVVIGLVAYRRTRTFDDFYLAGRKLNPWVTALSAEASSESGWLLLGLPGQAFAQGIGAFWVALGCVCGTFFNWTALAKRYVLRLSGCRISQNPPWADPSPAFQYSA